VITAPLDAGPARVIAHTASAEIPGAQGQPDAASSGSVASSARARALAASAVVAARVIVVIAQPEEPDQPDDEEPHVEDAEADHEDPPLGGHGSMLPRCTGRLNPFLEL
jgi:hypothetical protein